MAATQVEGPPPAEAAPGALRRAVAGVSLLLVALDIGSTSYLLWTLELPWTAIAPLAFAISALTAYELQWRFLLSPGAYRRAGSKARFLGAAAVIVAVNLGASTFLLLGMFYTYLAVRVVAAAIGLYAWTRWNVARAVQVARGGASGVGAALGLARKP